MTLTTRQREALNFFSCEQEELNPQRQEGAKKGPLIASDDAVKIGDLIYDLQNGGSNSSVTANIAVTATVSNIQSVLDDVSKNLYKYTLRINIPQGDIVDPVTIRGFTGGSLDIAGTWITPTITSGVTSGLAGAGSGSDTLNKPSGAPNWPNDGSLVGLKVVITGGGGYSGNDAFTENVATVQSHNASQLFFASNLFGLDGTTTFAIVEEGTVLATDSVDTYGGLSYSFGIINNTADVRLRRIKVSNPSVSASTVLVISQSALVEFSNCCYAATYNWITNTNIFYMFNMTLLNTFVYLYSNKENYSIGTVAINSSIKNEIFNAATFADLYIDGDNSNSNALTFKNGVYALVGGDISNATNATPFIVNNVNNLGINGALSGTNASVTYGAQIDGGGQFNVAGLSVGGNESLSRYVVYEDNNLLTYSQLSVNGCIFLNGSFLHWGVGTTVYLAPIHQFGGSQFNYGANYLLGQAFTEIAIVSGTTAHTSPSITSAIPVGYQGSLITIAAGHGDAIKMWGGAGETITSALEGEIENNSGFNIRLFPHVGHRLYVAGVASATNASITINNGQTVRFRADSESNWRCRFD